MLPLAAPNQRPGHDAGTEAGDAVVLLHAIPMVAPAPGFFSTITCWPQRLPSSCATMRVGAW
jgi:hypothetical protein